MRVLLAFPELTSKGGGCSLTAWTLQALRGRADVTLLSWRAPDLSAVNAVFGTSLDRDDFRLEIAAHPLAHVSSLLPAGRALLGNGLFMRACRALDDEQRYDRLLATVDEFDFGRPGIQYVHFPWALVPRPASERRWFHSVPGLVRTFQQASVVITGMSKDRIRGNRTLVNSRFVRDRVRSVWGVEAEVVYPPVGGGFPDVPWGEREDGIVCLGRIHPEKRLHAALEIVAALRARGLPLHLHLVGARDDPRYEARLRDLIGRHGDWVALHLDMRREEMAELVARQRYGLHAMHEEHFGIAVAEMQRAGCIVFVPRNGGPAEIVGGDERVLFDSDAQAADKIEAVLRSPEAIGALRAVAARRGAAFSAERFMQEMRGIVLGEPRTRHG